MGTGDSRLSVPFARFYSTGMYFSNQPTILALPQDLRAALDLLATGNVRVDDFTTHRLPLARFSEGIARFTLQDSASK